LITNSGGGIIANLIEATGLLSTNKLSVTTGENLLTATTGTNKLTTGHSSLVSAANYIQASGADGLNLISAEGTTGINVIRALQSAGSNILQVGGNDKITTTNVLNTITNTNNTISAGGNAHSFNELIAEGTDGSNTLSATGINGYNVLDCGGSNSFNMLLSANKNILQVGSIAKLVTTSASTTIYGDTNYICYVSNKINIEFGADTAGTQSFIDFHSNTTNAKDYDARIISGSTASASNAQAALTADCASFRLQYLTGSSTRAISVNTLGGIVLTVSDERLKENIIPIDANETHLKLLQLQPKNYEWIDKENMGSGTEIGLIAQDVIKIIPELVFTTNDDMYGIHYDKIPILLLQSIKELQRQIDELKAIIAKNTI
jgi:hypothetical protein